LIRNCRVSLCGPQTTQVAKPPRRNKRETTKEIVETAETQKRRNITLNDVAEMPQID
jgi:hypothetical protein